MRILLIDQFGRLGGAQRCLLDLVPAFQERGWPLRFVIAEEGQFPERLRSLGSQVNVLPGCALSNMRKPIHEAVRYLSWYPRAARVIRQIAAEFEPDLFYVNGPRIAPPAALSAKRSGRPLLFHAHNRLLQPAALWALGTHLRFARARVIACCRYVADSLLPYLPSGSIHTVYNGVPDIKNPAPQPSDEPPIVGVIGRIEPEKGQLDFVRAARLVNRELPSCRFVVIGAPMLSRNDTYVREIVEKSRDLPITFAGWKSDISQVLRELDLLVVPSLPYDAAPRVIIEAFSAGVPVLAFSSGGIPELIQDGQTGFLVDMRSPEALAARILEVLGNCKLLSNVAQNGRRKWVTNFRIHLYQRQVCSIILDMFGREAHIC